MKLIIDRFEGDCAICEKEDRTMINIKIINLPENTKEGDIIVFENGKVIINHSETKKRKNQAEHRMNNLWE